MEDEFIEDIDVSIKVIVIGNGRVGKSSLLLRYVKNIFTNEYQKTVGVEFLQKKKFIKSVDREVQFNIWDTAGQEYFDSITKKYYRGAEVAIFVFSVGDRDSFNAISSWKNKVLEVCESNIPMLLVMNKIDLDEKEKVVTDDEAVRLAASLEMFLFRVSVKDNVKITELFDTAAYEFFNKGLNKIGSNMPSIDNINNKNEPIKEIKVTDVKKGTNVDSRGRQINDNNTNESKISNNNNNYTNGSNKGFKIDAIPNNKNVDNNGKPKKKKDTSCC